MKHFLLTVCLFFSVSIFAQLGWEKNVVINDSYGTRNPKSIDIGDLDNDGLQDIAVCGSNSTLDWYKNLDGQGHYSKPKKIIPQFQDYYNVFIADVDNDGLKDIIYVLNYSSTVAQIYWCKNNGGGVFGTKILLATSGNSYVIPYRIEAVDMDNDNDTDIVYYSGANIVQLKNNGSGTFTSSNLFGNWNNFAITDINGDNLKDLILKVDNSTDSNYSIRSFKQNADGTFTFTYSLDSFMPGPFLTAGDLDNDGDNDVVVLYENGGVSIKWFSNNNGQGVFNNDQNLLNLTDYNESAYTDIKKFILTDVNGDNRLDIVYIDSAADKISWTKNISTGVFGTEQIISTAARHVAAIKAFDVDGDGDKDLIAVNSDDSEVVWYKNNGAGNFSSEIRIGTYAAGPYSIDTGDLNGDGKSDIVSASSADDKVAWYKNTDGLGNFTDQQLAIDTGANNAEFSFIVDIDQDGDQDVIARYELDSTVSPYTYSRIVLYKNDGSGHFTSSIILDTTDHIDEMILGDFNNDGKKDIVYNDSYNNKLYSVKNNGGGLFGTKTLIMSISNTWAYAFNDFDYDGDLDIFLQQSSSFYWLENTNAQGNFSIQHTILSNSSGTGNSRVIKDIDGDGLKDIAFNSNMQNRINWLKGDALGNFGPMQTLITITRPYTMDAADYDGDGDNDIVCYTDLPSSMIYYENNGSGVFSNPITFNTDATKIIDITSKDMNGDGKLDFVTTSSADSEISWFKNLGPFTNKISGIVRGDTNQNGCDSSDFASPQILVTTTANGTDFSTFTQPDGTYFITTTASDFNTAVTTSLPNYEAAPASQSTSVSGLGNSTTVDFCLGPNQLFNDLQLSFYPVNAARPGFAAKYRLVVKNKGTNVLSPTVTLSFNNGKLSFVSSSQVVSSQSANSVSFSLNGLNPFETKTINLNFQTATIPTANIGDWVNFGITSNQTNDAFPDDNTFNFDQRIVGPYDPNYINVIEGSEVLISDADQYLHYIIHFQNTGNHYAERVVVTTTLDSKLDWTTMQLEAFSHANRVEIENGSTVHFIFDSIYLQGISAGEDASSGYISFKIKPKATVSLGDIVSETANIFFDFNPAIVTNQAQTQFVDTLGTPESSIKNLTVYPNPTKGFISIDTKEDIVAIEFYNQLGQMVSKVMNANNADISSLPKGIYLMKIRDRLQRITVKKIAKE